MTTKENYFGCPPTLKAYVRGRDKVNVTGLTRSELVDRIEGIKDEVLELQDPVLPFDGHITLYDDAQTMHVGTTPYRHWQNFLKRGPEVRLRVPANHQTAIAEKSSPVRLRANAYYGINPSGDFSGIVWNALRGYDRRKRKVFLDDVLSAGKLFAFTENGSPEDQIRFRVYEDTHDAKIIGPQVDFAVPSRSSDTPYRFTLNNIPDAKSPNQYVVWTAIEPVGHGCSIERYRNLTFRNVPGQVAFCAHEIAAYFKLSKERYPKDGRLMLQPFPLFKKEVADFWKALKGSVLVSEPVQTDKGIHRRRRPLNMAEREALMHSFVGFRRDRNPLFAVRRKIRDYDW